MATTYSEKTPFTDVKIVCSEDEVIYYSSYMLSKVSEYFLRLLVNENAREIPTVREEYIKYTVDVSEFSREVITRILIAFEENIHSRDPNKIISSYLMALPRYDMEDHEKEIIYAILHFVDRYAIDWDCDISMFFLTVAMKWRGNYMNIFDRIRQIPCVSNHDIESMLFMIDQHNIEPDIYEKLDAELIVRLCSQTFPNRDVALGTLKNENIDIDKLPPNVSEYIRWVESETKK